MMNSRAKVFSYGPSITSTSPLLSGTQGIPYAVQLTAIGGKPPYTYQLASGTIPAGLTFFSNGLLSGTPTGGETDTPGFTVTDSQGAVSPIKLFLITIVGVAPLTITSTSPLLPANQGVSYSTTITSTGGAGGNVWSIVSQTGTNGWVINAATGALSSSVPTAETDSIVVQVKDVANSIAQKTFSITVNAAVVQGAIKYHTGDYMVTGQSGGSAIYVDGANSYHISGDLNNALTSNSQFKGNNANVKGIFTTLRWPSLEQGAQGVYQFDGGVNDPIYNSYMAVQAAYRAAGKTTIGDVGRFGFMFISGTNTGGTNRTPAQIASFDFHGTAGVVPSYIRDCPHTTYPLNGTTVGFVDVYDNVGYTQQANGPTIYTPGGTTTRCYFGIQQGLSGQCGHGYAGWTGTQYVTVYPTTWEIGTTKCIRNVIKAFGVYKLPYTDPVTGIVTWLTLDAHPLFEDYWWGDETSNGMQVGVKPVSIDNVNYPAGNKLSATGYWAAYYDIMSTACTSLPHTTFGISVNWTFACGLADDDTASSYSTRLPQIAAAYPNVTFCGPDTYSAAFATTFQATNAQQSLIGIANPSTTPQTPNAALSLVGKMGIDCQIQNPDWDKGVLGGSGNFNTITNGQNIILVANGNSNAKGALTMAAGRRLWWNFMDPTFALADWSSVIYPSFSGTFGQVTHPVNTVLPTNLSAAPAARQVGINFSCDAGGSCGSAYYEGFPIYKNRVREGFGFSSIANYQIETPLSAAGWPTADFYYTLWSSANQPIPAWGNGTWKCGFIGTGSETIAAHNSGTVANIVPGTSGAYTTFDFSNVQASSTIAITGTTGGVTNFFAYLPAYPASVIDNPLSASAFTTEAINHYKQYPFVRWMQTAGIFANVTTMTSANRHTPSNFQSPFDPSNGGSKPAPLDGRPHEWDAAFANACSSGAWINFPMFFDATYCTSVANALFSGPAAMPAGKTLYIEIADELWNGVGGISQWETTASAYPGGQIAYFAFQYHTIATAFKAVFGARFGTDVRLVAAWQSQGNGTNFWVALIAAYAAQGWSIAADFGAASIAPYMNLYPGITGTTFTASITSGVMTVSTTPTNFLTIGAGSTITGTGVGAGVTVVSQLSGTSQKVGGQGTYQLSSNFSAASTTLTATFLSTATLAQIQSALTANAVPQMAMSAMESISIFGLSFGLPMISYECGWQTNNESPTMTNITAAIMDSGMTAVMNTYTQAMLDWGASGLAIFSGGVWSNDNGSLSPQDALSNNWTTLTTTGSPRFASIQNFNVNGFTPTRNVVSGSGSIIQGVNYADNSASILNANPGFNLGAVGPSGFYLPPRGTANYVPYIINCTRAGTYSLVATFSGCSGSPLTNVEVGGVGVPGAVLYTGVAVSNGAIALGNVTLVAGKNYVCLGNGTSQTATINQLQFN